MVYAGGQQSDSVNGEALLDDMSWPGILVIAVTDPEGKRLLEEGGNYPTPVNVGPVRIVDAIGSRLFLAARNGTTFVFDVTTRQFVSTETNAPTNRTAGLGKVVESGNTPYQIDGYNFINYWYQEKESTSTITVLAGAEHSNPEQGVLVIVISPLEDKNTVTEEVAYLTPLEGGALRIVKADGEILTIVSDDGLIFVFDVPSRQFLSLPSGSNEAVTVVPLIMDSSIKINPTSTPTPTSNPAFETAPAVTRQPTYTPSPTSSLPTSTRTPTRTSIPQNTLTRTPTRTNTPQNTSTCTPTRTLTKTPTPTRTPTPRPTRTALPTYNPYP